MIAMLRLVPLLAALAFSSCDSLKEGDLADLASRSGPLRISGS